MINNDNISLDIMAGLLVHLAIEDGDDSKLNSLSGALRSIFPGIHSNVMLPRNSGLSKLSLIIPDIPDYSKRKAIAKALRDSELTINYQPPKP